MPSSRHGTLSRSSVTPRSPLAPISVADEVKPAAPMSWIAITQPLCMISRQASSSSFSENGSPTCRVREQKITIAASSGLTKDEIEKMRKDAEAHAEEDKKRRDEIEQRNEADNAVYRSEKMLKDNADKISGDDKSKIETAVKEVKEALKGGDASIIRSASEKLNESWQAVSAELYKAAAEKARASKAQGQPGPEAGAEPKGEDKKGKEIGRAS